MIQSLLTQLVGSRHRDVALTAAGMVALLLGKKKTGLTLFGTGVYGLEQEWRRKHPEFQGGWAERFRLSGEFYDRTHQHRVNRWLHIAGIPLIVGGAAGLLACKPYRPLWAVSATSFAVGWGLNFVGHGFYEKSAPAFRDDPLSFVAGPVWDLTQLKNSFRREREAPPPESSERPSEASAAA
jgi:hypothetical protein